MNDPMQGIAEFLGTHPPFDSLGTEELARLAVTTEMEFSPAAKKIFSQGAGPVEYLRVVRTGAVEIIHDGRVLDLVIAASVSPDAPVSAVMTEPVYTVRADRLGGDVLMDMLERGIHHVARSYLKEAFRAVSSVQSGLANELSFGIRRS